MSTATSHDHSEDVMAKRVVGDAIKSATFRRFAAASRVRDTWRHYQHAKRAAAQRWVHLQRLVVLFGDEGDNRELAASEEADARVLLFNQHTTATSELWRRGVRLVDPSAELLEAAWRRHITEEWMVAVTRTCTVALVAEADAIKRCWSAPVFEAAREPRSAAAASSMEASEGHERQALLSVEESHRLALFDRIAKQIVVIGRVQAVERDNRMRRKRKLQLERQSGIGNSSSGKRQQFSAVPPSPPRLFARTASGVAVPLSACLVRAPAPPAHRPVGASLRPNGKLSLEATSATVSAHSRAGEE